LSRLAQCTVAEPAHCGSQSRRRGTAKAGVKWWLIEAGGELAREKAATQTVKLTLEPALFDENGHQVELLIDAADHAEDSLAGDDGGEDLLDASG
jgi:hypothetical protein